MRRTLGVVAGLLLFHGLAWAQPIEKKMLDALAKDLDCAKSKSLARLGLWCLGPRGFKSGRQPPLPRSSRVYVGVTVELERGKPVRQALLKKVHPAALAVRRDGGQVFGKITSITPSNAEEKKSLGRAVFVIAAVLKGRTQQARLDQGLVTFLRSLPSKASYRIKSKGLKEWRISGASRARIRKLGSVLVAVEVPKAGNGIFLSLFTERFK